MFRILADLRSAPSERRWISSFYLIKINSSCFSTLSSKLFRPNARHKCIEKILKNIYEQTFQFVWKYNENTIFLSWKSTCFLGNFSDFQMNWRVIVNIGYEVTFERKFYKYIWNFYFAIAEKEIKIVRAPGKNISNEKWKQYVTFGLFESYSEGQF